ncbi:MAG: imidazole glycerol phosphate synthase subunit HisF [Methylacidiphilales bacterium]|nr:imidazole glycerol phosphate synthase subunit HisF [Candidatus Methylacidiphilales bacterium]
MPLTKRIIPCLDIDQGRVVKGTYFKDLIDAGNPVEIASRYNQEGADELVFLDITASHENRKTVFHLVEQVAKQVFIPLTVGGGIQNAQDIRDALNAGADKVSINSAAIQNPTLIEELASIFGSQCIVLAVDVKQINNTYKVFSHGGRQATNLDAIQWCQQQTGNQKAGELLLTSMDKDGTNTGFDTNILKQLNQTITVPIIASGGAGTVQHCLEAIKSGADAVLAASIFHFGTCTIQSVKEYLLKNGIIIRTTDCM